jgi:hypothetical protein
MLITAHGAAAALATTIYAKATKQENLCTAKNLGKMFLLGILPDVPLTALALSGHFDPAIHYHHRWITHTPIFWLAASGLVALFFSRKAGFELLSATWLHLAMDWYGGADGIAFLSPFTTQQFGAGLHGVNGPAGFRIYLSNPLFLSLEIAVQGTFLALGAFWLVKKFIHRQL